MPGLRNHRLFQIQISYVQEIRQPNGGGEMEFIGYAPGRYSADPIYIVAPNIEHAKVWANDKAKYFAKECRVDDIKELGELEAFIQSHIY